MGRLGGAVGGRHRDRRPREGSPGAALAAFVFTFEGGQTIGVDRLIVAERRAEIGRPRRDYLNAMEADRQATGWAGMFEAANEPRDRAEVHGDRATIVDSYGVQWTPPDDARAKTAGPVLWYTGEPRAWRTKVRRDRTGWRLWSVTIPPWCGGYSHCEATTTPSLTPSPSTSADDPLSGARSMLPCGPTDPLRQYHDCSSPSPSHS